MLADVVSCSGVCITISHYCRFRTVCSKCHLVGGNKNNLNTPGTAGGPGGRDRMRAVKSLKETKKNRKKIKIT